MDVITMEKNIRRLLPLLVLFCLPLLPAAAEGELLRIAVMDLLASDEIAENDLHELNALFANAVSETAVFQIAERGNIDKVLAEQSLQLSGMMDETNLARLGQLENADYLLIGSIGKLFGKVVLAARLVDVEKGKVVLARALTSDEERFFGDLKRFVLDLGTAAVDLNLEVHPGMIEAAIAEEDYGRAKSYLDRYIAVNGIDAQARRAREEIVPNLADTYAREADQYRRQKKFQEAVEMVQRALALRIEERYVLLRDRILKEEAAHLEKLRLEEERRAQRLENRRLRYERMLEDGESSIVSAYLGDISVLGHHLAVQNEWVIDDSYSMPEGAGRWGGEYLSAGDPFGVTAAQQAERGTGRTGRIAYFGTVLSYDTDGSSGNSLVGGEVYLSPYLARGFKLFNFVLLLGIDGGAGMLFSRDLPGGSEWYALAGGMVSLELKIKESMGLFVMMKGEYEWFPENGAESGPRLRAAAGLVL